VPLGRDKTSGIGREIEWVAREIEERFVHRDNKPNRVDS
jgi:hypothetical protein